MNPIQGIKKNLEQEKNILLEIESLNKEINNSADARKNQILKSINSLKSQLKILNNAIPSLLNEISPIKKLDPEKSVKKKSDTFGLKYISPLTKEKKQITVGKKDKESFAKHLSISESDKKIREHSLVKKPSSIARISNKLFAGVSSKLSPKFSGLSDDLKKANIRFSSSTYLAIAFFSTCIVLVLSLLLTALLYLGGFSFLKIIWVPFFLTLLSIVGFYIYPASERNHIKKSIFNELPFATIHMSAIAGSDIEPTKIFRIIAKSPEYPHIGLEMKKIINQVDIYGYDLVTSLKNAARSTSNKKLAELFSGMATNIVSGGSLKNYLDKKSENLLLDYKLERKNYSSVAETFMDIYISILVTAPLILVVMLIIMNVTGLGIGIPFNLMIIFIIGGVGLINILFLIFLQLKQPRI